MSNARHQSRHGLSLIEVLVAVSLSAILLGGLSFHLFAITNAWQDGTDHDFFEQHVEGVTFFLNQSFAQSEVVDASEDSEQSLPVEWKAPPGWRQLDDPLLSYRLAEAPPLFVRPEVQLPDITAYLHLEPGEGLSILWFTDLEEEEVEDTRDLYRTLVSPFVEEIVYCYYDRENDDWEESDDPLEDDDDNLQLPHFLKLTFVYEDESYERTILIPHRSDDVPLF